MKEMIKVIVKEPGEDAEVQEIANTVEELQKIVGGYFEIVPFDKVSVLIMNEEGKIKGLPQNFPIWNDIIVGPAIVAGIDGEDLTDVPDSTILTFNAVIGG